MDSIVVLVSVFAVFIPALILPGPDFVAVVRSSMTHGTRAGLLTTLGVSAGLCLYATLSLVGLSAILAEYQWLTWTVRVLGGCYLAWLGIKLLRAKPQTIDLDQQVRRFQRARHWIERAAGVCFIGLGGKVLADAGRPISP